MKTKELNVKDYQSRSDIKYSDFLDFTQSLNGEDIEEIDPNFLTMRILKVFYNIGPKDARLLKQHQVEILVNKIATVMMLPKGEMKNIIEMNGVKYGLIPDFSDITVGELIDLDEMYKEKDFIKLTSILYRPIKGEINNIGEYNIEDYKGCDDKFKDVSLDIVEGYMDFFYKSYLILNPSTQLAIQ